MNRLSQAFEQYASVEDPMVVKALKYMLLSKVMLNLPDEVTNLVSGKLALRCCNECSVQSITAGPRHTGPPWPWPPRPESSPTSRPL